MVCTDVDSLLTLQNERNNLSPLSSAPLSPSSTRSSSPNYQHREGIIYISLLSTKILIILVFTSLRYNQKGKYLGQATLEFLRKRH